MECPKEDSEFTDFCLEFLHPICDVDEQTRPRLRGTTPTCKCSRTRCLKLYCECLAAGSYCTNCACKNCQNKPNRSMRDKALQAILAKKPRVFEGVRRCSCRRSGCQKHYCECFHLGKKCTQYCSCRNCANSSSYNA